MKDKTLIGDKIKLLSKSLSHTEMKKLALESFDIFISNILNIDLLESLIIQLEDGNNITAGHLLKCLKDIYQFQQDAINYSYRHLFLLLRGSEKEALNATTIEDLSKKIFADQPDLKQDYKIESRPVESMLNYIKLMAEQQNKHNFPIEQFETDFYNKIYPILVDTRKEYDEFYKKKEYERTKKVFSNLGTVDEILDLIEGSKNQPKK